MYIFISRIFLILFILMKLKTNLYKMFNYLCLIYIHILDRSSSNVLAGCLGTMHDRATDSKSL